MAKQLFCRKCGKKIDKDSYNTKTCKNCKTLISRKKNKKQFHKSEFLKAYWKTKTGNITVKKPVKAKWIEAWEDYTEEKCATCNKEHFINEKYDHEYTAFFIVTGIATEELIELIIEYAEETNTITEPTKIKKFLEKRGLIE